MLGLEPRRLGAMAEVAVAVELKPVPEPEQAELEELEERAELVMLAVG